jgi:hypothetical protein
MTFHKKKRHRKKETYRKKVREQRLLLKRKLKQEKGTAVTIQNLETVELIEMKRGWRWRAPY